MCIHLQEAPRSAAERGLRVLARAGALAAARAQAKAVAKQRARGKARGLTRAGYGPLGVRGRGKGRGRGAHRPGYGARRGGRALLTCAMDERVGGRPSPQGWTAAWCPFAGAAGLLAVAGSQS